MTQTHINTDDCWLFAGFIDPKGYGRIPRGRRYSLAHRAVYEAERGEIPTNLVCDHLCRVRRCINPAHIELVTDKENILRGVGTGAKNAKKTHCIRGHEFTPENTYSYVSSHGGKCRACRTCEVVRKRLRYV